MILLLTVVNMAVMMLFEYGLPSPEALARYSIVTDQAVQNAEAGTIEAVEKGTAAKEAEAAETALVWNESESQDEREEAADRAEEDMEEDPLAPTLELTDDHIYLTVGDCFNYMSYIKTMMDVDGSDFSHYIHLDKDVDTSKFSARHY